MCDFIKLFLLGGVTKPIPPDVLFHNKEFYIKVALTPHWLLIPIEDDKS